MSALPMNGKEARLSRYLDDMRPRVDAAVGELLKRMFRGVEGDEARTIRAMLAGGKRLRGCLTCLVGAALGEDGASTLQRAAAVECIQAASLAHDDFVDQDDTRRGARAAWTVIGARRAVLLGDVLFATALKEMVTLSRADGLVLARAIATIAQGAYREPLEPADLSGRNGVDYNQLVRLKTGTLFGAAAELGANAAGASADLRRAAYNFGAQAGDAYQLGDDMADLGHLMEGPAPTEAYTQIAPVLAHYLPEQVASLPRALATGDHARERWLSDLWPRLVHCMRQDLVRRTQAAEEVLDVFPRNPYTSMLQTAAGEMVRIICPRPGI